MGSSRWMLRLSLTGIVVVAVLVAAWPLFVTKDYAVGIDSYRVTGDQSLVVEVTAGSRSWCRLTNTAETVSDIRVSVACLDWLPLPGNAGGYPHELTINLAAPLGDRVVRDGDGVDVATPNCRDNACPPTPSP